MARKSYPREEDRKANLLNWLYERGEETLAQVVDEVSGSRTLTGGVAKAVRRAAEARGQIDHNMQTVLNLLNVPSRADYEKLLTKMQTLQGSLLNINMKLDRLLAELERKPKRTPRARRPASPPADRTG